MENRITLADLIQREAEQNAAREALKLFGVE